MVGTAGWSIPRAGAARFGSEGTHLQRYARQLACVEINSSFYRPHLPRTYERWRRSTPRGFQFALKVPRTITHELRLEDARQPMAEFLAQTAPLKNKRGPLLVQLPPSFAFDPRVVRAFWVMLRRLYAGLVVCEPRHPSWFTAAVDELLDRYRIARVAADPAAVAEAAAPGGWRGLAYFRLHGSPRMYWSKYGEPDIEALAMRLSEAAASSAAWCVFDNTAAGAAIENAADLSRLLSI